MAEVHARKNENLEKLLRRFNNMVDEEKIIKTYRDKQYYEKPSDARRRKVKEVQHKQKIDKIIAEKNQNQKRKSRKK